MQLADADVQKLLANKFIEQTATKTTSWQRRQWGKGMWMDTEKRKSDINDNDNDIVNRSWKENKTADTKIEQFGIIKYYSSLKKYHVDQNWHSRNNLIPNVYLSQYSFQSIDAPSTEPRS